jgi:hypothetical protein
MIPAGIRDGIAKGSAAFLCLLVLACPLAFPQLSTSSGPHADATEPPLPARDDVWPDIQIQMNNVLDRLANFSCIQNIRRDSMGEDSKRPTATRSDFVRLQVTNIDGQEYYSFPGDTRSVTQPHLLVRTGLSGTGMFLGYARTVFVKQPFAMLRLTGREIWQGRPALRFAFRFDPLREQLHVNRAGGRGTISAEGEFLVDEQDHMLRWMRIVGDQPIPEIGIREVRYTMVWAPVQTDGSALAMPEQVEVRMELFTGEVQRNEILLTQCREFRVESALRFDDAAPDGEDFEIGDVPSEEEIQARLSALRFNVLPEGLSMVFRLDEDVDLMTAAVGDVLTATLQQDTSEPTASPRRGRQQESVQAPLFTLPQGAKAEFRIRRLERIAQPEPHALIWIELSTIDDGKQSFLGLAELADRDRPRGLIDRLETRTEGRYNPTWDFNSGYRGDVIEEVIYPSIPGVGAFLFRGDPGVLPKGYRMTWRSLPGRTLED